MENFKNVGLIVGSIAFLSLAAYFLSRNVVKKPLDINEILPKKVLDRLATTTNVSSSTENVATTTSTTTDAALEECEQFTGEEKFYCEYQIRQKLGE